jgi:hypothetical protein
MESTDLVEIDSTNDTSTGALMLNSERLMQLSRAAEMMASARVTVPKHLAGSPGDCLAVIMQATQWGMNPFAVAQKTHLVNGTLGYEAQLVNAVISSSTLLATRIGYEWEGDWKNVNGKTDKSDDRAVTVFATLKGESEPRRLRVSMAQAGVRNSPNWESDPRQQLAYLATKKWARLNAPDVLLGVYTPDELESIPPKDMGMADVVSPKAAAPKPASRAEAARAAVARRKGPSLEHVLEAIAAADTMDALQAVADQAKSLTGDEDKAAARAAWQERRSELEAQDAPALTYAQVRDQLERATSLDTLSIAADLIGQVADEEQRGELAGIYQQQAEKLAG